MLYVSDRDSKYQIRQAHTQDWPVTIVLEEASFWQHELETSQRTLVLVLFPERSSQGVARVSLILSMVFFHPGYDFPFPSRDGIVIMENLFFDCAKLGIQCFEVVSVIPFPINSCFKILQCHLPQPLWNIDHEGRERAVGEIEHLSAGAADGWGTLGVRQRCKQRQS